MSKTHKQPENRMSLAGNCQQRHK